MCLLSAVLRKGLKYCIYFLVATSILVSISWSVYPEKTVRIYAKLVAKIELRKKKLKKHPCHKDICYTHYLNDRVIHYLEESYLKGTQKFLKKKKDIHRLVSLGALEEVTENEYYVLDTMWYSYPYLTPSAKIFLDDIGERFHRKLENTGLECTRFTLTSMLRTTSSVARLRRWNRNSIRNSAHLHGTTFDLSYTTFSSEKNLSNAECQYLGDALAKTIWELRKEKKCWATYETWQTCIHVVSR